MARAKSFAPISFPNTRLNAPPCPEDLSPQINVVRRAFEAFNVPVLMFEGFEADDVIATLARRAEERDLDVYICTADKDARQLLNDHVRIFNLRKQEVLDTAALKADWGIRPDQVVDLLALTGDTVDNVPGVPGIGLKTASKLMEEFETLDGLLANVAKVSGAKRKENLVAFADVARRARQLIELQTDIPLELDWDALKVSPPDVKALKALCIECGFHRFVQELGPDPKEPAAKWITEYLTIDTPEKFTAFVAELAAQPGFASIPRPLRSTRSAPDLVGLSFCWNAGDRLLLAGARAGRQRRCSTNRPF